VNEVEGDLLNWVETGYFDVIVHGCNCQCVMSAGIARSIKVRFPEAYQADLATQKGDGRKLGTLSVAKVMTRGGPLVVVNAYTQVFYGRQSCQVSYAAVRQAFAEVKRRYSGKSIGYPRIGAGLAGGDWGYIASIIDEELAGERHTLVRLP